MQFLYKQFILIVISFFVNALAIFSSVYTFTTLLMLTATVHLTTWNAIELCFFCNAYSTLDELLKALRLSHTISVGSVTRTQNIRNLYRSYVVWSTYFLIATDVLVNVLDSTLFCLLLYHISGTLFMKMTNPVCHLLVTLFVACDAFIKYVVVTLRPRIFDILYWSSSFAFQ